MVRFSFALFTSFNRVAAENPKTCSATTLTPKESCSNKLQRKSLRSAIKRLFENNIEFKYLKLIQLICGIYILAVTFTYSGSLGVFGGTRDPNSGFIIDSSSTSNTNNGIIEYVNPLFNSNTDSSNKVIVSRAIVGRFLTTNNIKSLQ